MVGRSSDVYLSIFEVIRTETAQDSSTSYSVAVQEIDLPKKVIIRSYLFILREIQFSTAGTGPWYTPVPWTTPMESSSSPSFPSWYSSQSRPGYIIKYPKCLEKHTNVSMELFRNKY